MSYATGCMFSPMIICKHSILEILNAFLIFVAPPVLNRNLKKTVQSSVLKDFYRFFFFFFGSEKQKPEKSVSTGLCVLVWNEPYHPNLTKSSST